MIAALGELLQSLLSEEDYEQLSFFSAFLYLLAGISFPLTVFYWPVGLLSGLALLIATGLSLLRYAYRQGKSNPQSDDWHELF